MDIGEIDRFGEYVETLELAVSRLQHDSPARRRQALIGLDNLAEVLMYEICESILESDEFAAKLVPPRFTAKQKANIRWGFHEKVQLLLEEEILDAEEAELLNILHRYRNPAFHRFDHNPRSAWVAPEEFRLREDAYRQRVSEALRSFTESLSGADLEKLEAEPSQISLAGSEAAGLRLYSELDQRLRRYEEAIGNASRRVDWSIQAEIDRRRGK